MCSVAHVIHEESLNSKEEATITELTDDEALKLEKEIEKVSVDILFFCHSFNIICFISAC
jgi:hypothetical protein